MKKVLLSLGFITFMLGNSYGQLSQGGIPKSFGSNIKLNTPTIQLQTPDHDKNLEQSGYKDNFGPYIVSSLVPVEIDYRKDGQLLRNDDGSYTWSIAISVPSSKGLGVYFNEFELPQGVNLFIYNANKKHILGAFTSANNSDYKNFATEPVQGEVAILEMNIANESLLENINLKIENVASYFRGFDDLVYYSDAYADYQEIDARDISLFGSSSKCMINAYCSQSLGYENQRNATVQIISVFNGATIGLCSATMLNSLGNTTENCQKYLLTASHCGNHSTDPQNYSQMIVRFNYEQTTCLRTSLIPTSKSITGANFISRSIYNATTTPDVMKGDFLLLKVMSIIPTSWNVILNGWNSSTSIPTSYPSSKKFIGFHHPNGDIKKLSISRLLQSKSFGAPNTHWYSGFSEGYGSQGSSGSGYFDNEGRLIGIASLAMMDAPTSCNTTHSGESVLASTGISYSKLSYCWENPGDGSALPNNRKLKPWLDPANTGITTANAVTSSCTAAPTSIVNVTNELEGDFNIYPNPANTDKVQIKVALKDKADVTLEVFDITGKKISEALLNGVTGEIFNLDISNLTNGLYMIKFSNNSGIITKRLSVQR